MGETSWRLTPIHARHSSPIRALSRLYAETIREVNGTLANFETIKRFRIVADEWTQDTGELTPSMKIKRRVLIARYAAVIAELYADEATAHGGSAS